MDLSNGYEEIAKIFIEERTKSEKGIGRDCVRHWAKSFLPNSTVLDLGCGTGIPVSQILLEEGLAVYGIDASRTMVKEFQVNFPNCPVVCEAVENSQFFGRKFNGILSWGLLFLLPGELQAMVIEKSSKAMDIGGRFLFTAPGIEAEWADILTGQNSISLGSLKYQELLRNSGFKLLEEFEDEGENHYYHAIKIF